jgi:hypothetical protein
MPNENDIYGQEEEPRGWAGPLAKSLIEFQSSLWALEMASKGYKGGFHVPLTKSGFRKVGGVYKSKSSFSRWGRRRGLWGKSGLQFARPLQPGMSKIYEEGGLLGFRGARKAAAVAFGERAAASGGAKYLISRAAGAYVGFMGIQFAIFGAQLAVAGYKAISRQVSKYSGLELGGYFPETQGSYTSRQRALQAITASNLQAKSAIGNEAYLMHH